MRRAAPVALGAAALAAAGVAGLALRAGGDDGGAARPRPPVVQVLVPRGLGPGDHAVGFAVAPERVVTVAHVLGDRRPGERVVVRVPGGAWRAATIVARDDTDDLAVLAVGGLRSPVAATTAGAGALSMLVTRDGRVLSVAARVRRPITARVHGVLDDRVRRRPALELAAEVHPGDSGAPLVTADGRVAGVVFARSRRRAHTAYAVDGSAVGRLQRSGDVPPAPAAPG